MLLDTPSFDLNLNQILNSFVYTDRNVFNIKISDVLHKFTLSDGFSFSNKTSQISHNLTLSDKFTFSNNLNDILTKYDSFPTTFRNQFKNLSYDLSKEYGTFTTNLNNLSYDQSKELSDFDLNLNNLRYELSQERINSNTSTNNLGYGLSKELTDNNISTNNLSYNLSKESINLNVNISLNNVYLPEIISSNIKSSLIYVYSPEIISSNIKSSLIYVYSPEIISSNIATSLSYIYSPEIINVRTYTTLNYVYSPEVGVLNIKPQVDYTLFKQSTNNRSNLSELTYNLTKEIGEERLEISVDTLYSSEKSFVSQSLTGTELYYVTTDQATASKITFVPYDSSSNLTFNSSSLRHYVRQINEVFYMSGSQLTSSRINYQDDIELIVIGKGSTTTYKDNLDYNLPYRASFLVKNWPHYQYNTSSYWYLPVPLNASNDDILASGDIWVTASFQNGNDVFTDQYGFAIDI